MMRKYSGHRAAKKGITISEMCVVLGVVAVVALAVVSFTTMVSAHTTASSVRLNAMEDLELTQSVLEKWIVQMEAQETQVETDGESLTASVDGQIYTVSLADGNLILRYLDSEPVALALKTVSQLRFETMENTGGTVYFCTAVYYIEHPTKGSMEQTFTFCVDSRVGEVLG